VALEASATKDTAVFAHSDSGRGIDARSKTGRAVSAASEQGVALEASATKDTAVFAHSDSGTGIDARSKTGYAGIFTGNVLVTGDIQLQNADCAEDFQVADTAQAPPGTVMVLVEDGTLKPCAQAYDQKVVGVVAGAGSYRPGIVFDRVQMPDDRRVHISVMGKVACRADASFGAICIGDLLTTSPRVGCAMRVSDSDLARGSIIGKALSPLNGGEGLVNMLIALQ
jgi:hypothetical protein